MKIKSLFILLLILTPLLGSGQCIYKDTVVLEDLSANNFYLDIEGIINDSLSLPGQGVCEVGLKFNHSKLGDILIELTSPAGQSVALVGPTGDTDNTSNTLWDVSFVPCGDMADPDPGFPPQWDSEAPWGLFGDYDGSYFPFFGCLEDFDEGSANGLWTLYIDDQGQFDDGTFFEFSIVFCDPQGIACQSCFADGGGFPSTQRLICESDIDSFLWPVPEYLNDEKPDTSIYDYRYILSEQDTITGVFQAGQLPDINADSFSVCGLSYLEADSSKLDIIDSVNSVSVLDSMLTSVQPPFCGAMSSNCVSYTVDSLFQPGRDTAYICNGDTIVKGDSVFTETGTQEVVLSGTGGCDSTVLLTILPLDIRARIVKPPPPLTCFRGRVGLNASASVMTDSTTVFWTTDNGSFASDSTVLNVSVDQSANYTLHLVDGNCRDSATVFVDIVDDAPEAMAEGDTLDCGTDSIQISGQSTEEGNVFFWSGPGGFSSNDEMPFVSQPGVYILTVTDSTACQGVDTAIVHGGGLLPRAEISSPVLSCDTDTVRLNVTDTANINFFSWSGPMGFTSTALEPLVTQPGWYDLNLSFSQQCNTTVSYQLTIDTMSPTYELVGDTLNCVDTVAQLAVVSNDSLTVEWSGPSGFSAIGDSVETNRSGIYTIQVEGSNGCNVTDSIRLLEFIQPPTILTQIPDTLGCGADSVSLPLSLVNPVRVQSVSWTGPGGFVSSQVAPSVQEPGTYMVEIIGTNGCVRRKNMNVVQRTDPPEINLTADTLTCDDDSASIDLTTIDSLTETMWTGPEMFTSVMEDPVVAKEGWYVVEVTGNNRCSATDSIFVPSSIDTPEVEINLLNASCRDSVFTLSATGYPPTATLQWTGEEPVDSDSSVIEVATPGLYSVIATTAAGCTGVDSILLTDTLTGPQFLLSGDTLGCDNGSVPLNIQPTRPGWTYSWSGPDGFNSVNAAPVIDEPGLYVVAVTDADSCTVRDSIRIENNTDVPDIQLSRETDTLVCPPDTLILDASGSDAGSAFEVEWRTDDGKIISGSNSLTPTVTQPGLYIMELMDTTNGCSSMDSVQVITGPNRLEKVNFDLISLGCGGSSPGKIIIQSVEGGEDPFDIFIDDIPVDAEVGDTIEFDSTGLRELGIESVSGCRLDTTFLIGEQGPPIVDVGPDLTIQAGDEIWLQGQVQSEITLDSIRWEPAGLSRSDSLAMLVSPTQSREYRLFVTTAPNCSGSDALTVTVTEAGRIYIPNVFSPNNDGVNDLFYVQSGLDGMTIRSIRIFNRWGDLVYERFNFAPNNPSEGWNGEFKGKRLQPQVFVYEIEVVQPDGRIERYSGDLSLIR